MLQLLMLTVFFF